MASSKAGKAKAPSKTKISMAHEGTQYSRGSVSLSWPFGGEREVLALEVVPQDVERCILEGRIVRTNAAATKVVSDIAKQRLLTGDEARARKAEPAGPVYRQKFVDGELIQVPVIDIANLPPREEIGTEPEDEDESEDESEDEAAGDEGEDEAADPEGEPEET